MSPRHRGGRDRPCARRPARRGADSQIGGDNRSVPSLRYEKQLWAQGLFRVVGVDEVGMAALAGPVVAAACLVTPDTRLIRKVNDSKVLTRLQREALLSTIRGRVVKVGIGAASVAEIHRLNIYHASHVAMLRALRQIGEYDWVLVDGRRILDPAFAPGKHSEIVRGDAKSFSIAAASIVAKVTRDRLMQRLAAKYPGYGWEHNCGYPTIDHRKALRELGVTPFHRQDFGTVRVMLSAEQMALDMAGVAGLSPS